MLTQSVRIQEVLGSKFRLWSVILTAVKRNVRAVLLFGSTGKRRVKYRFKQVTPATRQLDTYIEHTFQTDDRILGSGSN